MKPSVLASLLVVLLLGYGIPAVGQSRFSLSVNAAPVWSFANTSATFLVPDGNGGFENFNFATKGRAFNYQFGLLCRYHLSPHWSVATGLWGIREVSSTVDLTQNGQTVTINSPLSRQVFLDYKVPVLINFQPLLRRLSPYLTLGATANIAGPREAD